MLQSIRPSYHRLVQPRGISLLFLILVPSAPRSLIGRAARGLRLSRLVSLGNQADVTEADMLAPVAEDPYTRVIALYLEGVKDGRHFLEQAQSVSRDKPIVALKVGRYERSQAAVASHTGALAGMESAYNAAFHQAGVIRADTTEQLL